MAVLALCCCVGFSPAAASRVSSLAAVCGPLAVLASRLWTQALGCEGFRICGVWAHSCGSWALEHSLSICGTQALLFHSIWDLSGLGIKPMSPAWADRFFTAKLRGKPSSSSLNVFSLSVPFTIQLKYLSITIE